MSGIGLRDIDADLCCCNGVDPVLLVLFTSEVSN